MAGLVEPVRLRARIHQWFSEEAALGNHPAKTGRIMDAALYGCEKPHGELDVVVGTGNRQSRRVAAILLKLGVPDSDGSCRPLHRAFPAMLASCWTRRLRREKR